ncbi:MAG: NAD(P)H-hydrate dehydratase [Opitutales bacterium]|nr:NAD(P)H-hydrate dehydratase [Opitutales bacterium]
MSEIPSHPVLTCKEAMEWEGSLLLGEESEWKAMSKVGQSLGAAVARDFEEVMVWPNHARILVLVGKGHNGGDALLAAAELVRRKPKGQVSVVSVSGPSEWKPLTRRADEVLRDALSSRDWVREDFVFPRIPGNWAGDVLLDGLLGMQFRPPLREPLKSLLDWCGHSVQARFRVAVDLPSGRSAETEGFPADISYATGLAKETLFVGPKPSAVGRVRYLDIGFFDRGEPGIPISGRSRLVIDGVLEELRRPRSSDTYKNRQGKVWLIGGSLRYPGSILLSAMAAVRSGAGLVYAMVPDKLVPAFAAKMPEVIWMGCPVTRDGNLAREARDVWNDLSPDPDALVIGPGLGAEPETHYLVGEIGAETPAPLVLDAEALNPLIVSLLRRKKKGPVLATPHRRELERVSGRSFSGHISDLEFRQIAEEFGWLLLLKAPPFTRITDGQGLWVIPTGGPVLARGGSGDLLAGMVGRLIARENVSGQERWGLALAQAAFWHGLAADKAASREGSETLAASDFLRYLGPSLRETLE